MKRKIDKGIKDKPHICNFTNVISIHNNRYKEK